MEIWVRSQDKKFFGKVKAVDVMKYPSSNECAIIDTYNDRVLGYYRSEERCLEIVDKFQKLVFDGNAEIEEQGLRSFTFMLDMPKE